jgi:hypothetical protein
MGTDGGKNDLLKGQTDKRLLEMIRSCLCISKNFIRFFQQGRIKKPKGNGIKEGAVRWGCVYAVVFLFFLSGLCGSPPLLLLRIKIFYCTSCVFQKQDFVFIFSGSGISLPVSHLV